MIDNTEEIKAAYIGLSDEDIERIDRMAEQLIAAVKARSTSVKFSKANALEVLAMTGVFLNGGLPADMQKAMSRKGW